MAKKRTIEGSSKELSARERIALKHPENTVGINEFLSRAGKFTMSPAWYASVRIEDPEAPDDEQVRHSYLIADKDGTIYATGSESFMSSFLDIFTEMQGEEEPYEISVFKAKSRTGKDYITCALI